MLSTKESRNCQHDNVSIAPPPWELDVSDGWICPFWFDKRKHSQLLMSDSDRKDACDCGIGIVMVVSYRDCPVGGYDEFLVAIPCKSPSIKGEILPTYRIPRIYVSSEASLRNGRRNWGIRKELADFKWNKSKYFVYSKTTVIVRDRITHQVLFAGGLYSMSIPIFLVPLGLLGKLCPLIVEEQIDEEGQVHGESQWVLTRLSGCGWCRLGIGFVRHVIGNISIRFVAYLCGLLYFPVPNVLDQV